MNSKHQTHSKKEYLLVLLFFLVLHSCTRNEPLIARGLTMGTVWMVNIQDPVVDPSRIKQDIQAELDRIDELMSNWKEESDVCRFNRLDPETALVISKDTARVITSAQHIYKLTHKRFDPTLSPLIDLWGFATKERGTFPKPDEIQQALQKVGFEGIALDGRIIRKTAPERSLNLSAIAKGYAVDCVYDLLISRGYQRVLVEVGGEVRASQHKEENTAWRIGVESPLYGETIEREIIAVVGLSDQALATSGDYRNFFEYQGRNYSHIINPTTGYPVASPIASASVVASSCMQADALATAFMILSPQESIAICNANPDWHCLIVERESGVRHYSDGMKELLEHEN
ncbi:MAG: thiamine biosynthesis protein ApbE [Acidobacteria bacterium]|nr:MAG: thiamine biosynthesis protein ApbE [Acidobacteriota bacterium]